jgi:hypothetical protein
MAKYKKYRRPIPLGKKLGIAALAAVLVFFLVILVIKMMGLRYIELTRDDGTVVKFTGWISEVGTPVSGKLYFSDGVSASIEDDGKTLVYSDGVRYTGEISAAYRRHGQGTITLANGDVYSGTFVNDAITGSGVYTFTNGDVYEGELIDGLKNGKGIYRYANGDLYEGGFYLDFRDGEGKFIWADGSSFEGIYAGGLKTGYGVYKYANGDLYEGNFELDMRQGLGKYVWASGESYEGEFYNNTFNGYGTYIWTGEEGRASYSGYFADGQIKIVK